MRPQTGYFSYGRLTNLPRGKTLFKPPGYLETLSIGPLQPLWVLRDRFAARAWLTMSASVKLERCSRM